MNPQTVTIEADLDLTPLIETLRASADALASVYAGVAPTPKPAHRLPCVDGSVCGEAAHCPPEPKAKVLGYTVIDRHGHPADMALMGTAREAADFAPTWKRFARVVAVVEVPNA